MKEVEKRQKKGRKKENLEHLCSRGLFGIFRVSLDTGRKK